MEKGKRYDRIDRKKKQLPPIKDYLKCYFTDVENIVSQYPNRYHDKTNILYADCSGYYHLLLAD